MTSDELKELLKGAGPTEQSLLLMADLCLKLSERVRAAEARIEILEKATLSLLNHCNLSADVVLAMSRGELPSKSAK